MTECEQLAIADELTYIAQEITLALYGLEVPEIDGVPVDTAIRCIANRMERDIRQQANMEASNE